MSGSGVGDRSGCGVPAAARKVRRPSAAAALILAGLALAGCKILPTARQGDTAAPGTPAAFDADKMVADIWDAKVIPYVNAKAGDLATVRDLAARAPDEAGKTYGYRAQPNAPWTVVVRIDGRIVAADTASRAATIGIDVDGDGKSDATVQIGPAMRGTALRDSLDFISFNSFTNQIDFAQFGKAFNQHVNRITLSALPRDGLVGRRATVIGAYVLDKSAPVPLVTPATVTLGPSA